jgi:hypothetical protein
LIDVFFDKVDGIGSEYHAMSHNCRDVAEGVARALSRKAGAVTVSKVIEAEWSRKQIKMGWMIAPFSGGSAFQPFEGYIGESDVHTQTVAGSVFRQLRKMFKT